MTFPSADPSIIPTPKDAGLDFATPILNKTELLSQYRKANKRLFMFDYDGTLTSIVEDPQAALPSDRLIATIKELASDPSNAVWIISGRDQAFLEQCLGHISELGLSAEHGSFVRRPKSGSWDDLTATMDKSWQSTVMQLFQDYTQSTPGSFTERKKVAITWHWRQTDPKEGARKAGECFNHLKATVAKEHEVEIIEGKANVEVRLRSVNKGEITKSLVAEYGDSLPEFILCSGDDGPDEDMFDALRRSVVPKHHVFSVLVGPSSKQTLASWHLPDPTDVVSCLELLNTSAGPIAVTA
ncbi:Trehalose-phosphate synthase subunit [Neofusicoccum parvum]|uniref:Trehalose-phosphate synthase subunit n=1 Tax=Neofusicoccum parvum TaxID=310453 RepID=A0ACB5SL56_9PEZI|nr:Trehalose-phosphate synthase subunit [Neofusicoccum parvum]